MPHNKLRRTCSECGASLAGKLPSARTCTDECRQARSRRIKRAKSEGASQRANLPDEMKRVSDIVAGDIPEVAHEVIQQELRPVVREAMTEDVLRSIHQMVGLTPKAIAALSEDLESDDPVIRQRATALVIKYTMGHPALVRPQDTDPAAQLTVNIGLPRPEAGGAVAHEDVDVVELRTCDMCAEEKPLHEFAADSARCEACWAAQRAAVAEQYGEF